MLMWPNSLSLNYSGNGLPLYSCLSAHCFLSIPVRPCAMASTGCCKGWPESALLREPTEYAAVALPYVSAASSRETANYTSNRATMRSTSPDDNGKLESPLSSSTRNRTTTMSQSSTVDLGALLPGEAPLAKLKAPVYHLQLNISCSCSSYKEDDQYKRRTIGTNTEDEWEEQRR
ncbi:uncharacterized protein LOC119321795 isoform X2 [Triticum dicoccoides]|uniref:uncharacterized protein LOC119321795 isoform X2 n=1 Tax=Triticum dicoccoides TaxID=85692 RepID=UPI00188EF6D7|nr:uncharacterized protein LOC119321795 isoform X2 [Triticum dicoccoides]